MTTLAIPAEPAPLIKRRRLARLPSPAVRRVLREASGWTQQDIADRLGVSNGCVSCWERGLYGPRGQNEEQYLRLLVGFAAIARQVGVSVIWNEPRLPDAQK